MRLPEQWAVDKHTVVLYRLNEGEGNCAYDACGDESLTLRAQCAQWSEGEVRAARFPGGLSDGAVFTGPVDHPKLMLKTCPREWTVEAWVRVTGPRKPEGITYFSVCGTDDEGFGLRGRRGGFSFSLIAQNERTGLAPSARYIGNMDRNDAWGDTSIAMMNFPGGEGWRVGQDQLIQDQDWHHVAWQYRLADQRGFLFLDGEMIRSVDMRDRPIVNNTVGCGVPFTVGGMIHSVNPPYFTGMYNFVGEICQVRISNVLRYSTADSLRMVDSMLPEALAGMTYRAQVEAEGQKGLVTYTLDSGKLPEGLRLLPDGQIEGRIAVGWEEACTFTVRAVAEDGGWTCREWTLAPSRGFIEEDGLPPAFVGKRYEWQMHVHGYPEGVRWTATDLPCGYTLSPEGILCGTGSRAGMRKITMRAFYEALAWEKRLELRVLPSSLDEMAVRPDTVFMYDWRGDHMLYAQDVCGDPELALGWTNMGGDRRYAFPGREGRFPQEAGNGEHGYASVCTDHDKHNLRLCPEAWTVEAWVRVGGPVTQFGHGRAFHGGHVCGTYDTTERGVWELYLTDEGDPEQGWTPGAHFFGQESVLMHLNAWKRPEGLLVPAAEAGIHDTQWHHIAWQFEKRRELHQLLLDGRLIWQMRRPDGVELVNDRHHEAQFSVFSRLTGYCLRGCDQAGVHACHFNYCGKGNFFGQIGEIRVSSARLYQGEEAL